MLKIVLEWLSEAADYRRNYGRPLVSLCYAQSLDGSLTARRGAPTSISGSESSQLTHQLRSVHGAIMVGIGTVVANNPRLTVRLGNGDSPQPVILDTDLNIPLDAYLVKEHPKNAWVFTSSQSDQNRIQILEDIGARIILTDLDKNGQIPLFDVLGQLATLGVDSLMVEGGVKLLTSFLALHLADQVVLTVAPKYLGGTGINRNELPNQLQGLVFPGLIDVQYERLGEDITIYGKLTRESDL